MLCSVLSGSLLVGWFEDDSSWRGHCIIAFLAGSAVEVATTEFSQQDIIFGTR